MSINFKNFVKWLILSLVLVVLVLVCVSILINTFGFQTKATGEAEAYPLTGNGVKAELAGQSSDKQAWFDLGANNNTSNNASDSGLPPWPRGKPGVPITNMPIAEMTLSAESRKAILGELDLFRKTGSASGGVVTNEFAMAEDLAAKLKKEGLQKLKQSLAILPTELCALAGSEFQLKGADSQAKFVSKPNEGWSGFLQICEDSHAALIELSENQYEVAMGDSTVGASDFDNIKILDSPASLQVVTSNEGVKIYSLQWALQAKGQFGARSFNLVAKNMSQPVFVQLAERISLAYLAMPNEGWKKPYILTESVRFQLENRLLLDKQP